MLGVILIPAWIFLIFQAIQEFSFGTGPSDSAKIIEVTQWGPLKISNGGSVFNQCSNLVLTGVTDTLNLVGINSLYGMFYSCTSLTTVNNMNSWNVSNVTNMDAMFFNSTSFNQPLSSWTVSSVTNMSNMFLIATSFNQNLSHWCVTLIPSLPVNFDTAATSWVLPRPVWGTCPP